MSYRDQDDAALDRAYALTQELARLRGARAEADRHEREIERVVMSLRHHRDALDRLRKGVALPMLDDVRIASPCSQRWADMTGDDRARLCERCDKTVFDLSAMTREEAELVMLERTGVACVRLFRRDDGTVLTEDCPIGARRRRLRLAGVVAIGAGLAAAGAALALAALDATPNERVGGGELLVMRADPADLANAAEHLRAIVALQREHRAAAPTKVAADRTDE